MLLDWRENPEWSMDAVGGPCEAFDAATGELVPNVFRYDTVTHEVVRYATSGGLLVLSGDGNLVEIREVRKLRLVPTRPAEAETDTPHLVGAG